MFRKKEDAVASFADLKSILPVADQGETVEAKPVIPNDDNSDEAIRSPIVRMETIYAITDPEGLEHARVHDNGKHLKFEMAESWMRPNELVDFLNFCITQVKTIEAARE